MEPFPFVNFSTDLVLSILEFAARPDFTQIDDYPYVDHLLESSMTVRFNNLGERNPYTSALALCQVSRVTRRAALPELLRTVLLPEDKNFTSFVHALRMQEVYHRQGHHLYFEYTAQVRRIWIGQIRTPPPTAGLPLQTLVHNTSEPDNDFNVLTPVILGADSLALNVDSL